MKLAFLLLLLTLVACSPPTKRDSPTVVVQTGAFELEGSRCRLFEVSQDTGGSSWHVQQRFSLCDPPLGGMLPGSKPGVGKEPNIP